MCWGAVAVVIGVIALIIIGSTVAIVIVLKHTKKETQSEDPPQRKNTLPPDTARHQLMLNHGVRRSTGMASVQLPEQEASKFSQKTKLMLETIKIATVRTGTLTTELQRVKEYLFKSKYTNKETMVKA